jgi:hypothetical protein
MPFILFVLILQCYSFRGPHILPIFLSNILNMFVSFMVNAQVSNPYIITGNINASYTFNPWIMEQKNYSFYRPGYILYRYFKNYFLNIFFKVHLILK